ncbi:GDYXXLXY domain-containing protein [uncultured Agitococcus sp.]|uniref:GDYXXLXY domain-containing protein n=1 Tax=uncultured Agitococcus sp. TaxID=1506599 RepID=UPI00261AD2CF|nr:GDYXXLXY domain-containing protein [uncultured Agitococcus sp.]
MNKYAVSAIGLLILIGVNGSIWQKEQVLSNGQTVFLTLAPVDPRSIMQGDYMRLRFELESQVRAQLPQDQTENSQGFVLVKLDDKGIAQFINLQTEPTIIEPHTAALQYRVREGKIKFATDAFFFEEGQGDIYAQAKYGEFKVAENGELLLTDLRGESLIKLNKKALD